MSKDKKNKKKKTIGDFLLMVVLVAAIGVFLFAGYQLYSIYREYKIGTDEYKELEQLAVKMNTDQENEQESGSEAVPPPITVDFAALKAINDDVVGWLYVEALGISYPIVQGKDNEQYLHTTYEGTYNFAGSIFIDYENSRDFKDPNTIVYGHNMKNGSMFGILRRIVSENAYANSPYFWILTPEHNYRYAIFAAYTTAVNSDTYTLFEKHDEEYEQYLKKMKGQSEVDTGETMPNRGENVATLSTCTGNSATRFVVQGVQLQN